MNEFEGGVARQAYIGIKSTKWYVLIIPKIIVGGDTLTTRGTFAIIKNAKIFLIFQGILRDIFEIFS